MNNSSENINIIIRFLKKHQFRLNIKSFLNTLATSLNIGSLFLMIFELLALFIPLYYAHIYGISALLISLIMALFYHIFNKVSLKSTALFIDSFGFKEGLITALENKDNKSLVFSIQRNQVTNSIKEKSESIKYSMHPSYKKILLLLGILLTSTLLGLIPTDAKARAIENHELAKQVKEKEKQLDELIKELDSIDKNELAEDDQKSLDELLTALSSSYSEYQNVTTNQQLIAANDRLSFKLEQIENHLTNEDLNNIITGHMPQISPYGYLSADNNIPDANQDSSNSQNNGNNGQGHNNGQSQNNNGSQGQNNDPNNSHQNQGQNGQGQDGQNQNQSGDNSNDGADGDDASNNNGQGQSNDQSSENDQSGSGRGEGTSNNQRDYISIPNDLANDPSLNSPGKTSDNNDQFLAGNGLNFEGEHVPYSAVISEYTNQAYDGISQGKYPSNMENVIKDYFSSFN